MNENTIYHWIAATQLPDLGPIKLSRALEKYGSPTGILERYSDNTTKARLLDSAVDIEKKVLSLGGNRELILNSSAQKLIDPEDLRYFLSKKPPIKKEEKQIEDLPSIPKSCKLVYNEIVKCQVMTPYDLVLVLNKKTRVIRTRLFVLELLRLVRRIPGDRYILA